MFLPRFTPYHPPGGGRDERKGGSGGFSFERYRRNREWEAALGILAGYAVLVGKMIWL